MKKLERMTVTEIGNVMTVFSKRGRNEEMKNRICYGLSFCEEGKITYTQAGQDYVSDKQHAVILPKGGSYHIRGDETGIFPVINFECTEPLCDTIMRLPVRNPEPLMEAFAEMKRIAMFDQSRFKLLGIFYQMLELLTAAERGESPALQPAMELLENGYMHPQLSNADLANVCHLSEVYFRKLFVKVYGITPRQYLLGVRIRKAQQLLREGMLKIWQVAEASGFSNEYHFSRTFKQHTGMTPSEYTRKQKTILRG